MTMRINFNKIESGSSYKSKTFLKNRVCSEYCELLLLFFISKDELLNSLLSLSFWTCQLPLLYSLGWSLY